MYNYFSHLRQSSWAILELPSWRAQQCLVVLSEVLISFLALFLIKEGVPAGSVLIIFSTIYMSSGFCIRLHRKNLFTKEGLVPFFLAALALAGIACVFFTNYPILIALTAFGVITLKDLVAVGAVGDIHKAADKMGVPPSSLVSVGMFIGALTTMFVLSGSGPLLTFFPSVWMVTIGACCVCLFWFVSIGLMKVPVCSSKIVLPLKTKLTCFLSMIYNATSFVGKRFIVPLAVAKITYDLGFEESAYTVLGAVLSLLVLLGLSLRGFSGGRFSSRKMMYGGYFSGLCLWLFLAFILASSFLGWPAAILALVCLLLIEITAKIWTLGFVDTLRLQAKENEDIIQGSTEIAYFTYFMELKGYGAGVGFLVALLTLISQTSALVPTACFGILIGLCVLIFTRCNATTFATTS
jgi:hypothetical protein